MVIYNPPPQNQSRKKRILGRIVRLLFWIWLFGAIPIGVLINSTAALYWILSPFIVIVILGIANHIWNG